MADRRQDDDGHKSDMHPTGPARPEAAETDVTRTEASRHEPARPETVGASPGSGERPQDEGSHGSRPSGDDGGMTGLAASPEVMDAIRERRGWFVALGIALLVAGTAALLFPFVASVAAKVVIGWLMLIAGAVTLWHAFQTRDWSSTLWNALIGLLSLAAGVYLAFFPLAGLIGLTLFLGAVFAVQGVFEVMMALQNRDRRGWGWMIASGVLSVVLGVVLMFGLPGTAVWALGLLVGVHFITSGASLLALTWSA
ncbi:HdeD family acid-resistance protein [Psychromarinibacter sp. C21-152]|uniref:HdeD family acid-resistance protein n=1 Tax=Psychromarinibacter sediminicola TaxID=3033385 RepID=A0AAE3NW22_9RHOB|nr:HdeD family acid-resistance protein [Psychromarinibacter sediminicola]MDF0603076.1 HdeD family acid-resistance protein [Psychromarinibacter sediminicola]